MGALCAREPDIVHDLGSGEKLGSGVDVKHFKLANLTFRIIQLPYKLVITLNNAPQYKYGIQKLTIQKSGR